MKIKTKIQLFSSIFMLLLIVLVNTSIYFLFYKISTNNELEQLSVQTNSIVESLHTNRELPPNQLLHAFVPQNGMIRIIDKTEQERIPTITKRQSFREIPATFSNRETKNMIRDEAGTPVAIVLKPVIWENGEVVTLQVVNYLFTIEETMRTLLY